MIEDNPGPELSADFDVNIPLFIAWKLPISNALWKYGMYTILVSPVEMEIISTPSAIASSNAARVSA